MRRLLRGLRRAGIVAGVLVAAGAVGVGGGALTEHLRHAGGTPAVRIPASR